MPLHLTKVAVGCASYELLVERTRARDESGAVHIATRYRPTRHTELIGGSLFWIIKHRLVARQEILGFGESEDGRCSIILDARLMPVLNQRKTVHQGWRYLETAKAPADLGWWTEAEPMPSSLREDLSTIGLL